MKSTFYHYKAKVVSVYDGDTITVDIDLGMHTWVIGEKLRLYGINAPEMRGKEKVRGTASRDFLRMLLKDEEIIVETIRDKKGKYGRFLANVYVNTKEGWANISEILVEAGHAKYKNY